VTIKGNGVGGRNQEMLLAFVNHMVEGIKKGEKNTLFQDFDFVIASIASDGQEGNSPAAGAIVTNHTIETILNENLDTSLFLENNDSFHIFQKIGNTFITGQTGTNVNDIIIIYLRKKVN